MFGSIGVMNYDLTLRELMQAYEGRQKSEWGRTSLIACIIANANRDPSKQKRPFTPSDFNPYEQIARKPSQGTPLNMKTVGLFKSLLDSMRK